MKTNKFTILFILFYFSVILLEAQAKKPILMILPSDSWCIQRYFITEFDIQGSKMKLPNYKEAFQEDTEIGQVISKIGGLMIDRGFPLKDAEQELKSIELQTIEDAFIISVTNSANISESPLDLLKKKAKSDIIIQVSWSLNKSSIGRSVNFTLEAFDTYTNKRIASSSGTSNLNTSDPIPVLLEYAIQSNIEPFVSQLQSHFTDMIENGREITLKIKRWQNWNKNLESEFDGIELNEIINDWCQKNTVNGRFNLTELTENQIIFEQVRIPLYDEKGQALDARGYLKNLQKYLKQSQFNIESKLIIRGLGEAIIILGEK